MEETAVIMPQGVDETGEKMPFHLKHEQLIKEYSLKLSLEQFGNLTRLLWCYFHEIQPPFTGNDYILYRLYLKFCERLPKGKQGNSFKLLHFQVIALTAVLNGFSDDSGVMMLHRSDLLTVRDELVQHQSNLLG